MTEPDVEGAPPPEPSLLESLTPVAPDWAAGEAAQARLAGWRTATGTLADVARWVGTVRPDGTPFHRIRLIAFAADHGVADGADEARALLAGEGALALLAERAGVSIRLIDAGLAGDPLPGDVSARRVRAGSPALHHEDPLTPEQVDAALDLGARVADEEVDAGADLVIPVVLTESALIPATVIIGSLCDVEPVRALGYDAHVPDAVWIERCAAVRDGMRRVSTAAATLATRRLLAIGGGADLAAAAGFLVRTAARRTPALLDGVGAAAAALVARALAFEAPRWWYAPHGSGRAGEKQAFSMLSLEPAVNLGVRLGDGAGALLALPVLTAAIELTRTAPQRVEETPDEVEVTVDPGDEIGGVGGYDAGPRAPEADVPIVQPEDVDPAVIEPLDPADPLAVDPEPSLDPTPLAANPAAPTDAVRRAGDAPSGG
ncbi:nicotinate-nucleotide--dimethylbenzimidazole phosphoribosyltransferase [Cryptosporangium sp. NPDC048952]|uniref:nicotinate-nucleotide--dimethylbenzimidazole phosphoribosyltransferase n=1 Tax=Cryptosporangium sp. NPDC048952 TaxID=3363961 RepID=UPI003712DFFE